MLSLAKYIVQFQLIVKLFLGMLKCIMLKPLIMKLFIPRDENITYESLATLSSIFRILFYPNKKCEIEVKHRPSIPDNSKHWQVFDDDQQIKRFLEMTEEFENTYIDEENKKKTKMMKQCERVFLG